MVDKKQAAAEGILERIWKEEWKDLDLLLGRTGDVQFWADIMRFELDLGTLTKGLLHKDSTLASLKEFQVESMSPFHYAGLRGAERVLRRGLQVGLNVEIGLRNGTAVLHLASFAGKLDTLVLLVDEFKANVNREDGHRLRPLHYACAQGHQQVAELLVNRGADIGARDFEGATAAYHARLHRHQPIVSYLLEVYGDGDVLLVEEQSLDSEVQRTTGNGGPVYTSVCKKSRKQREPDYEEVELSFDTDTTVKTVKRNPDADESRPANEDKDATKSGETIIYENIERLCASASDLETQNGYASAYKTQPNNDAKDTFSCEEKRHVDQCNESSAILKCKPELIRRRHRYKEIKLPSDSVPDPKVSDGYASVEDSITTTKEKFGGRNHLYQEIELPDDTTQHSEMGLHNRYAIACTENTPNVTFDGFRQNNQYEELDFPRDSADPESKISDENATAEEIIEAFDISKFVRRKHHYEEIKLPCDEDPQSEHLNEHQVEHEARQLLRNELRKLELTGRNVNDDKSHNSDAIKDFFDVSEIAEDVAADSDYDLAAVITLRQLRRLLREEFQQYAEQLRLKEPLSKLEVPKEEVSKKLSTATSNLSTGLYDEIAISTSVEPGTEVGQIERIKPVAAHNPRGEGKRQKQKNKRDDSPLNLLPTTERKKPEITEQTNKESKLNCSPLLRCRDPRNRKEKGNSSSSLHLSPLPLNAQNDKHGETDGSKTEQGLKKSEELLFKAGQSQFYIRRSSQVESSSQI